jgi:tRNA threonylcarbamoyladenosine biosynthesis protein TsaB
VRRIAVYEQNSGFTHSETLLPMIEDMLKNCGVDKKKLGKIAVAVGPGSYTGLRIGCATAKGLAWSLDIACRPVSTLSAMAFGAADSGLVQNGEVISAVIDAKRGNVYNALFSIGARCESSYAIERLTADRVILRSGLCAEQTAQERLICVIERVDAWGVLLASLNVPDAEAVPNYVRAHNYVAFGGNVATAD